MLILMHAHATREEIDGVMQHVRSHGYEPIELPGADRIAIGVLGSNPRSIRDNVVGLPGVVEAVPVSKPYKMVGLEWHPDRTVVSLDPLVCPCSTMFRIDAAHLAWVLEGLVADEVPNRITVDADTKEWAKVSLQRMLDIT